MRMPKSTFPRITAGGKFFRLAGEKFYVKGLSYGPFPPNDQGDCFGSLDETRRDFDLIRDLGANTLRVYQVPPAWFLDLAAVNNLRLLIDVPWNQQHCFLASTEARQQVLETIGQAARTVANHPAVFALSVANELPPDVVRWNGAVATSSFIDELVGLVKEANPDCLATFGNYPPTEFLRPQEIDFHCFNVYLHQIQSFENYLARLQMIADTKPLLLGEFGLDSLREGETNQSQILASHIQAAFQAGLAGTVIYSFSDSWYKDGREIADWQFGVTSRERQPKPAYAAVQSAFHAAPYFPLPDAPRVSVVVACYNGARTLKGCLESLQHLNYPDYEVILVDDGSADETSQIAGSFPHLRFLRHATNQGLSVARNTGIQAATGEIVAFTDADCRADEDWLHYLIADLRRSPFAGIGGHNLLPPDDSWVASAVMVSPGGPAHVMHTDRIAEHIPGCNMAFYKRVLEEIGGFDPIFRQAGDDVDLCWRLQQEGYQLGFSPSGFVWHYRRQTVHEYLVQQSGYGEAEALLLNKHPEKFSHLGRSIWEGQIYAPAKFGVVFRLPRIYHGLFGSGFFQALYPPQPEYGLRLFTSLEFQVLVTLPLCLLSISYQFLVPAAGISLLLPLTLSVVAAWQARISRKKLRLGSRPLVALLFFMQPLVRGWARYRGRLSMHPPSLDDFETLDSLSLQDPETQFREVQYWVDHKLDRMAFLSMVQQRLDRLGWQYRADAGWNDYDVEMIGGRWTRLQLLTAREAHQEQQSVIRCRLGASWTLLAKSIFFSLLVLNLLVVRLWAGEAPWVWGGLLSLGLFPWWLSIQQKRLRRLAVAFLDETAKQLRLVKVGAQRNDQLPAASG
jgi:O-antigen biosynthesis protein